MEPEVLYRVHKSPPLVPILKQIDLVDTTPSYVTKVHFNIVHPPTSWSSQWSLSYWLFHQQSIYIPLLPHSCYMTCPHHLPSLDHSNYVWREVQVTQFSQSPVTSSLFGSNILLNTLFSNTLSLSFQFHTRIYLLFTLR
jgi:hypothetical protein